MKLKKLFPVFCAMAMFFACSMTVFAGNYPSLEVKDEKVEVSHESGSDSVKVYVNDWKASNAYVVKLAIADDSIAKVELSSQHSDYFKLKIKPKGTGTTVVKVWLDGYSRSCEYIIIDSINYQRDDEDGVTVKHYGYMTGENGEAAVINDYEIKNVDGQNRLYVYFDLIDRGYGDASRVTFSIKCEEEDGDSLGVVKTTAVGMVPEGTGYKVYFRLPNKTAELRIENNDL